MKKKLFFWGLCLLAVPGFSFANPNHGLLSLKGKPLYVPGEVLVTLKPEASSDARLQALGLAGSAQALFHTDLFKVTVKAGMSVEEAVDQLKGQSAVKSAQPNYRYYALGCSPGPLPVSDLYYSPGPPPGTSESAEVYWPFEKINAEAGWSTFCSQAATMTVSPVTVAVVDSGVDFSHPNFSAAQTVKGTNTSDSGGNSTDDDFGHGTFVAGLIAAPWGNGPPVSQMAGLAGMSAGTTQVVKIMPVKVLDNTGSGSTESIVNGMDFAYQKGVRLFNLSLGGPSDGLEQEEINILLANNCVIVAAAGNESGALDYPAGYPGVVAVGATDENNQPTFYTNFGPGLDLMAPGGAAISFVHQPNSIYDPNSDIFGLLAPAGGPGGNDIFVQSTDPNYCTGAGTSFSTPLVTGAAALLLALNPSMTNLQIVNRLVNSADSLNNNQGWDPNTGYGLLDVGRALVISGAQDIPTSYMETFNSPNPFSLQRDITTNITVAITQPEPVELTIRDGAGDTVLHKNFAAADLNDNPSNPQFKSFYITWDGKNGAGNLVAPGVYFYTVTAGGVTGHNKIVVLKGYYTGPR